MISAAKPIATMPEAHAGSDLMIEIVWALPERYWLWTLSMPSGATVGDALARWRQLPASGQMAPADIHVESGRVAIFSRVALASTVLHDHDRIELLRPLAIDPMQGRRLRAERSRVGRRKN